MTLLTIVAMKLVFFLKFKKGFALLAFTIGFLIYLFAGGFLFQMIEGPELEKAQKDILDIKKKIIQKDLNVSEALDEFMSELRKLGVRGIPDPKGNVKKFTLADAVFFSSNLLTTIGYGHVALQTLLGRVLGILYTTIGIPITLILLASYVNLLEKLSEIYKALLFLKLGHVFTPFQIRFGHIATIMAIILLLCFILPAIVFSYIEGWSMFDSIYYCFISLTTVGLGDMVPGLGSEMDYIDLYRYCVTMYTIIGLTIMMFMMSICSDFHQNYNCSYESLPFTISSETIPFNQENMHSYGTILIQNNEILKNQQIYPNSGLFAI